MEVERAEDRIRPWIVTTPLEASPIGGALATRLHLKLENQQHTGSFKARGAFNRLLALGADARAGGVIAASTGNHGAAVAYAAGKLGLQARIVVSEDADAGKVAAIKTLGGAVEVHGRDSAVAEGYARRLAGAEGVPYVSPYNDPLVVAGQGTIGVELERQLPRADAVFIALGGGGLLAGVGTWLRTVWPGAALIGCSPANSAVMIESIRRGEILDLPSLPTLSDGTAGGIEPGAITFGPCRELATDFVTVTEEEIRHAMRMLFETHRMVVEGAAGVALAGYLSQAERWRDRTVVIVVCGGNVSPAVFRSVR
ncbi:MAG: threonine/serine dehydratase [Gemmatimonadales bacterium]|nr:threonine/serine dehydratase [Gemmatimonadales bacterium]